MGSCMSCGRPGPGGVCPDCRARGVDPGQPPIQQQQPPQPNPDTQATTQLDFDDVYRTTELPVAEAPLEGNTPPPWTTMTGVSQASPQPPVPPTAVPPQAPKSGMGKAAAIVFAAGLAIGIVIVALWWFVLRGDDGGEATTPLPSSASPVASEEPSVEAPPALEDGQSLTQEQAMEGVEAFLVAASSDPAEGWKLMSRDLQGKVEWAGFEEEWTQVQSAKLARDTCSYEAPVLTCNHLLDASDGTVTRENVVTPVIAQDGIVKIDVGGDAVATIDDTPKEVTVDDLEAVRAKDLEQFRPNGQIVAVLSSKRNGITDPLQVAKNGTNTFYYEDILAMHEDLVAQFGGDRIYMLQSRDFQDKKTHDLYYTVADRDFTSKEQANAWCEAQFQHLSKKERENQCYGRQLG